MELKSMDACYIAEAVSLATGEYQRECTYCPQLIQEDFKEKITSIVTDLFQNKYGKVAVENGKIIGYLAFEGPWDGFFGTAKGVFSPLGGSAFAGKDRAKLASILFESVAEELVKEEICSYAISRYAHDEEVGNTLRIIHIVMQEGLTRE